MAKASNPLPGIHEDIRPGKAGTLDARKKPAKPAGTSAWNPTMIKGASGSAGTPVGDSKHEKCQYDITGKPEGKPGFGKGKVAKPAGTSSWNPTMI
jgi:hypothetical protein